MADDINNEDLEPVEPVIPTTDPETPLEPNDPSDIIGGVVDPNTGDTDIGDGDDFGYTPEQIEAIKIVRLNIGDSPSSPFYPLFDDDEIATILEYNKWNVRKATRQMAIAASMNFSQMVYRERTGDIEVWNNVSIQYQKALENIIKGSVDDYGTLRPYFGGIDWCTVETNKLNPENVRSPLTQINESGCYSQWDKFSRRVLIHVENPNGEEWNGEAIVIP